MTVVIQMRGLIKRFGSVLAVHELSFEVQSAAGDSGSPPPTTAATLAFAFAGAQLLVHRDVT